MIRYGDYFSRKELFYLGVNPNKELSILKSDYNVEDKYEKVSTGIKEIYEYLKNTNNQTLRGKSLKTREDILNNKVQRRIVAAFYDLGILEEKEKQNKVEKTNVKDVEIQKQENLEINPNKQQIVVVEAETKLYDGDITPKIEDKQVVKTNDLKI